MLYLVKVQKEVLAHKVGLKKTPFMQQVEAWAIDLGVKLTKPQNSEYSKLGG